VAASADVAEFDQSPQEVMDAVTRYAEQNSYRVTDLSREKGRLEFRTRPGWATWAGEQVTVLVQGVEDWTRVTVHSRPRGFQIYDWGEGKRQAQKLLAHLRTSTTR